MNTPIDTAVYTDVQGLASLRRQAGENSPEALNKVAKQFEALFLQMMLKSMRDAGSEEGGLFDNEQTRLYQDMYDKQLSLSLSEGSNGIGLAKLLVNQLQSSLPQLAETSAASPEEGGRQGAFAVPERGSEGFALQPKPAAAAQGPSGVEAVRFESPEQFVATLWPEAQRTGERLGIDPRAILAQAALETGWGKSIIRHGDGRSSFNLFNIKAGNSWEGERVGKQTLEYRDGVALRERASFRAYSSFAESFDDYAALLSNSGRYRQALAVGPDGEAFAEQLQDAGYATDPSYARKIKSILNNDLMASVESRLKIADEGTLT